MSRRRVNLKAFEGFKQVLLAAVVAAVVLVDILVLSLALTPYLRLEGSTGAVLHLLVSAANALALFWAFLERPVWLLASAVIGAGVLVEAAQHFIPGRSASASDMMLNLAGAGLAFTVSVAGLRFERRRRAFSHSLS